MLDYKLPEPVKPQPSHHILDASKLNAFQECPRKFFYEYILGWRSERPNNHLIFGSAWHEALEHMLIHGYDARRVADAYRKFELKYRETFPDPEADELFWPKTPDRAFEALALYAGQYSDDLEKFNVLHTEIAFTVQMDEKRALSGRMDSILRDNSNGQIKSLEHKTASSFNRWAEQWPLSMQAGTYTHAMYCLYGYDNVDGVIFSATAFKRVKGNRGGTKYEFMRCPTYRSRSQMQTWYINTLFWMDQVEREYELLSRASAEDDVLLAFPLNTTSCNKWFGCMYKDFCNSWRNPLRRCAEPPLGMVEQRWNPMDEDSTVRMTLAEGVEPIIEPGEK